MKKEEGMPWALVFLLLATEFGNARARAEQVDSSDPTTYKRFISGYSTDGTPVTTSPTPNTSSIFVAAGYDLSGVGWNALSKSQSFTMVSPIHFAGADHFDFVDPNPGFDTPHLTFLGSNGQLYQAYKQSRQQLWDDANLGVLTTPIPNSAHVAYYGVLDKGDTAASYVNTSILVYGWYAVIGSSTYEYANWNKNYGQFFYSNIMVQGGDSGSPTFIPSNGTLTLAGTRSSTMDETSYAGGIDASWVDPFVVALANWQMAPYGYAMKVTAVPTKIWSGQAGTSDFNTAGNWQQGTAPSREGIAFDAGSANGRFNVNVSSITSIKGITFTPTSGNGFTFSGSTLQLGTGGLINNSPQTQTFNNNIQFCYLLNANAEHSTSFVTGAQHWTAASGNLVVNGNVDNNGFQLVVDGAKNTTINGIFRGSGGLGKEGTGTLILTNANTYTGNTTLSNGTLAVNNTTGSGTGDGNLIVWGGRLQGNGRINGSVTFRANGDPEILAPGNADLGQTGTLTIKSDLTLSSQTSLEIHLNGLLAGNEFDQVVITSGNVDLSGATLQVTAGDFATTGASAFWIINNVGSGSLLNQFAGLSNGAPVMTIGGNLFCIYYGVDFASGQLSGGNDVVLVAPEPASLAFCGGFVLLLNFCGRKQRSFLPGRTIGASR